MPSAAPYLQCMFERPEALEIDVARTQLPAALFHVAPSAACAEILREGLDAGGRTWNTGAGGQPEGWRDGWLWLDFGDGPEPVAHRPEGVYAYADSDAAEGCAAFYARTEAVPFDVWTIDMTALPAEVDVIRDPTSLEWTVDAYVIERVPAAALTLREPQERSGFSQI